MVAVTRFLGGWRLTLGTAVASAAAGSIAAWQINDAFDAKQSLKRESAVAKAAIAAVGQVQKANEVTADVGRRSAERQVVIRTQIQDVIREVPRYVTEEDDRRCDVPGGFVRLHDAAAAGGAGAAALSDPTPAPDDSAPGVELSSVAETVIGNYGVCHAERDRLRSLQEWITAQAAAWNQN